MKELNVRITLTEQMLGMASADPEIYDNFIASKAPNEDMESEEVNAIPTDDKGMTVFPRDQDGDPCMWDYQMKGFFKDAAGMLRRVNGTKSKEMKAYKKIIDGLIFVKPRMIKIHCAGPMGTCQRPLRAQTLQGERIALASSETVPAGSTIELKILCHCDNDIEAVKEWLNYGEMRGLGQWRNSGMGTFTWEEIF